MITRFPPPPVDQASFTQRTKLDDREYLFTFKWNSRADAWYFDLETDTGESLLAGVKIVIGRDFLLRCLSVNKPPGRLVALPTDGSRDAPTRTQLGGRVRVLYFSVDEDPLELDPE